MKNNVWSNGKEEVGQVGWAGGELHRRDRNSCKITSGQTERRQVGGSGGAGGWRRGTLHKRDRDS